MSYSEAISACYKEDLVRVTQSLTALQLSLNNEKMPALSAYLLGILDYCQQLALNREFAPIANALISLRDSLVSE